MNSTLGSVVPLAMFSFPFPFPGIFGNDSLWFPFLNCGNGFFSFPSRSWILGIDFFLPFSFQNFGNDFFHSLPAPGLRECFFSIAFPFPNFGNESIHSRSRSRTLKCLSRSPLGLPLTCNASLLKQNCSFRPRRTDLDGLYGCGWNERNNLDFYLNYYDIDEMRDKVENWQLTDSTSRNTIVKKKVCRDYFDLLSELGNLYIAHKWHLIRKI